MLSFDRRADAVIRWLERMKSAYTSGALDRAYLDAECASADLEDLRTNIFSGISRKHRNSQAVKSGIFPQIVKPLILSVIILMLMIRPISRENVPILEPEISLPEASPQEFRAKVPETPKAEERTSPLPSSKPKPRKQSAVKRTSTKPEKTSKPKISNSPPVKKPAYDRVNYLLETGRRALKTNSIIRINERGTIN